MVHMIFAKQKQRHRRKEHIYGHQRGKEGGMNWEIGTETCILSILSMKQTINEKLFEVLFFFFSIFEVFISWEHCEMIARLQHDYFHEVQVDLSILKYGFPWWFSGKDSTCPMQETRVQPQGWKDTWKEEMATHSSLLAWEIPGTEEPDCLQPLGLQGVGDG